MYTVQANSTGRKVVPVANQDSDVKSNRIESSHAKKKWYTKQSPGCISFFLVVFSSLGTRAGEMVNLYESALSRADPTGTRSSQLAALLLQVVVVVAVGITGGCRAVQWAE